MYNSNIVIPFLVAVAGVVLFPVWYGLASGSDPRAPALEKPAGDACVATRGFMRAHHMDILGQWRKDAVRRADKIFTRADGRRFEKSLTHTCMDCHEDEERFCGGCHGYAGVEPSCWGCHNLPGKE